MKILQAWRRSSSRLVRFETAGIDSDWGRELSLADVWDCSLALSQGQMDHSYKGDSIGPCTSLSEAGGSNTSTCHRSVWDKEKGLGESL